MTIKEKLKQFIRVNNIKQKEIAEILGVTQQNISNIFNGKGI